MTPDQGLNLLESLEWDLNGMKTKSCQSLQEPNIKIHCSVLRISFSFYYPENSEVDEWVP